MPRGAEKGVGSLCYSCLPRRSEGTPLRAWSGKRGRESLLQLPAAPFGGGPRSALPVWLLIRLSEAKFAASYHKLLARFSPSRTQVSFHQAVVFPHSVVFVMKRVV